MAIFVSTNQLLDIYNIILHEGLTTYKAKHSKATLPARVEAEKADQRHKKGAVFVVRSKADFTSNGVKGYIITSKETLLEDAAGLSHFTPNVYREFGYTDDKRTKIRGFEEKNLLQINTFVVDIDTKRHSVQDILLTCMDESIGTPTFIVESDRGYQVYFVLSEPLFISNKQNYRGLTVAKRIADNLKRSLQSVDADIFCNDFGFFRLPKQDNIVWHQLDQTYTMAQFIEWSRRQDDDLERPLFVVPTKLTKTSVVQSEWFTKLIHAVDIKGEKGQLGRNNAMFTLALICFSEGWEKERTFNFLDEYNTNLRFPLSMTEIETILDSAYSGKYNGASKQYIEELLAQYVPGGSSIPVRLGYKGVWYKFKKERKDRVRSHYEEWEKDIIQYISAEKSASEMFLWRSQKELCEAIGIPQSTLNVVLKRSTRLLKTTKGKGRNAKTGWTTISLFIQYALKKAKEFAQNRGLYRLGLQEVVNEWINELEPIAGYELLLEYLHKLNVSPPSTTHELIERDIG
ncbi:primase-like protein [Ureibacillus xyleni]|uniref:Primase-like protein n=1 Tax=Ureibacillus xyleni TaxID=614648 RepID=A0A285TTW2_9BACL|nr:primase C-terminal domain-containing protein [Ureibacillus xyleni]SOC25011.1 primase-like protein [Ureibacillus xyleni]